jgi:hypothetical protein
MRVTQIALAVTVFSVAFAITVMAQQPAAPAQAKAPAGPVNPDPWPKMASLGGAKYTMYQPQLDTWDLYDLSAHAAVSVLPAGAKNAVFGVIELTASTYVSRQARTVYFQNIKVEKVTFPTVPDAAFLYQTELQKILSDGPATMPLDKLEANLAILNAEKKGQAVPVGNEPPVFVFTQSPAVLVTIDGDPVWTGVEGTSLRRVLNARPLILSDSSGQVYIHILDGFLQAPALSGPWTVATTLPGGANQTAQTLAKQNVVDLMQGTPNAKTGKMPSLKNGAPELVVATTPTELIVTQGTPDWVQINGTQLLYVQNTTGNVFNDMNDQQTYVLVTGRWFRSPGLSGPWQSVSGNDLPADFRMIPDNSPKENVKASVPGTAQAQEAVISNEIPEMAPVDRQKAKFETEIIGEVQLKPIPDTGLFYVANSPTPIIEVSSNDWYACQSGVWFAAASVMGPWSVATGVPAAIYSIPPSSPVYYVTYVKVYTVTPTTVVVGYTPGYMGTVVSSSGTVVYGTGYTYVAYVNASVWYPPPVTYGYAAAVTYTPWTGWAVGFGFGFAMGAAYGGCWGATPYWGAMPYAYHGAYYGAYGGVAYGAYGGAAAWGPGGWAATSGNIYHQYGATSAVTRSSAGYNAWTGNAWSSKVGTSYNSVTGQMSAGQHASVSNAYTGNYGTGSRGATYNPTTGVAAAGGRATVGNAYTGQQATVGHAAVSGPGGQTAHVQQFNNSYFAEHDGNVYSSSGGSWQQHDNSTGGWNDASHDGSQSWDSQNAARQTGDQRSSASGWGGGGGGWGGGGGGFGGGSSNWSRGGGGSGGGSSHGGGGGWGGGGGFSRGGGGGGGGWGGGSFGGFRGGGGRR